MDIPNLEFIISDEIKYFILLESNKNPHRIYEEKEFYEMFDLGRNIIKSALDILVSEGYLLKIKETNTYIYNKRITKYLKGDNTLKEISSDFRKKLHVSIVGNYNIPIDKFISLKIEAPIGTPIYCVIKLYSIQDNPVLLETSYILKEYISNLEKNNEDNNKMKEIIDKSYLKNIKEVKKEIKLTSTNDMIKKYLKVTDEQILIKEQVSLWDDLGRKIEYRESIMKMEAFVFES